MSRWAGRFVVIVCAMVLALGGLGQPSAARTGPDIGPGAAASHTSSGHDHSPADQQNTENSADCCMLACVPVILNACSAAKTLLQLEAEIAPVAAVYVAKHRGEPPFHPPRRT